MSTSPFTALLRSAPAAVCCSIAPPDLLARLATGAESGQEQRDAAVRALAASASMRTRRAMLGHLSRELNLSMGQLSGLELTAGRRLTVYDNQRNGWTFLPGTRVRGWGEPETGDQAVDDAYENSSTTHDFYRTVLGRDSIDDAGMELVSTVHYGAGYDNAFWQGSQMVYGDGSGQIFQVGALAGSLDVAAHELAHGVTEFTAGLRYSKQSGALNESWSDVFGSMVKQYSLGQSADEADWLIGAGTLVPSLGQALRSMSAPGTAYAGDRQPGHMDGYVDLPDDNNPANDNGGVHINSGIPNHAFYLAATALGGHAWEVAGKIWYAALTERLQHSTDFSEAAQATVDVAAQMFGSSEQAAVHDAWKAVGVLA